MAPEFNDPVRSGNISSAFYVGKLWHKRFVPRLHSFCYPLYMMALDLDEVDQLARQRWWFSVKRWAPLQLKPDDYLPGSVGDKAKEANKSPVGKMLKQRVLGKAQLLGCNTDSLDKVLMLAQMRCFGFYFSPVNFFFLYEKNNARQLLVEVSNTPWNERHYYLVDLKAPAPSKKSFHVSPFMDMDMEYRWAIKSPRRSTRIAIENWNQQCIFKAVFVAKRKEFSAKNVALVLAQWPVVTGSIVKNIYWQAFKLFLKGMKYVPYTSRRSQ